MATDQQLPVLVALDREWRATGRGSSLWGQDEGLLMKMLHEGLIDKGAEDGKQIFMLTEAGTNQLEQKREYNRNYKAAKAATQPKTKRGRKPKAVVVDAPVTTMAAPAVQIETTCQHDEACATCEVMEILIERVPAVRELYDLVAAKRELAGRENALLARIGGG